MPYNDYMWHTLLAINGVIWVGTSVFLIYSIGAGILKGEGKQLLLAIGLFLLSILLEIIFAAKAPY